MARKIPSLGRFLGVRALYAMAYGEISSSLYYALGITAVYALSLTPVVFAVAGFIFALAAAAYAEGGATIPEAGGASAFARRAFNDLVGFIAGWATVLDFVLAISLSALFLPYYFAGALGQYGWFRGQHGRATVCAVAIVLVVTVVRMLRRTDAYTIGVLVAALDLVMQVGIAVFGLVLLLSVDALKNSIELGTMPTWNAVAFALPIAMIGYTGLEKVGSLAGVAKNPEKSLPDSVRTSVFTVVIVYSAVATAAVSAFPTHPANNAQGGTTLLATRWVDTPMLGLAHAIGEKGPSWAESALRIGVGFTACTILLMAIATSFSGCARLAEAMGRHSQLPPVFGAHEPACAGAAGGDPLGLGARDRLPRRRLVLLRRGDPHAGVALLVRDPDRLHADPGGDHLASDLRARPAEAVHDERQRLGRPAADPRHLGRRRRALVRRVGRRAGHAPRRAGRRPAVDARRARDLRRERASAPGSR